jgi:hypothetical protein
VRAEIAIGAERFEKGGKSIFQSLCVQLARMGCVVWQWDMLSDSDAIQLSAEVVHRFAKQRPEMNTTENWGLYSPQAESHLQSIMGLQTLNAVRGLDFLLTLPEVDPDRTAITGASGGGTQTMLLAAIDDRIELSFPCVMVSTSMQGGCTCENASLLRIGTGNIEFAGLFAPKPQGMNTANDWTKEMATKGFPDLQALRAAWQEGQRLPPPRRALPAQLQRRHPQRLLHLPQQALQTRPGPPVIEQDYEPLTREQLTVWDDKHPAPKLRDPEFERQLLKWLAEDNEQLNETCRRGGRQSAASRHRDRHRPHLRQGRQRRVGTQGQAGPWRPPRNDRHAPQHDPSARKSTSPGSIPKNWKGRVVIWLDDRGSAGLPSDEVKRSSPPGSPSSEPI